jgi:hypothetical protein
MLAINIDQFVSSRPISFEFLSILHRYLDWIDIFPLNCLSNYCQKTLNPLFIKNKFLNIENEISNHLQSKLPFKSISQLLRGITFSTPVSKGYLSPSTYDKRIRDVKKKAAHKKGPHFKSRHGPRG